MAIKIGPDGITMNDTMMNLVKGWFVIYKDGSLVVETDLEWGKVKKGNIKILGLKWYDKIWTISGRSSYIQFKRGSVSISPSGVSSDVQCIERCIGYYEGAKKVVYRVDEMTGKMTPAVL